MDRNNPALQNALAALELITMYLDGETKGLSRDPREPKRLLKTALERRIGKLFQGHFARQQEKILTWVGAYTGRKAATQPPLPFPDDLWDDPDEDEFQARLILALTEGGQLGIQQLEMGGIRLDWTLTNTEAAKWAREYSYELIKGIDDTTREATQAAITQFVETPGMTMGDLKAALPFNPVRSDMIATTEVTRAYARGQTIAAVDAHKEFPDLRLVRTYYTNNDDRVCDICGPYDGQEVPADIEPPLHVNCRCWIDVHTSID